MILYVSQVLKKYHTLLQNNLQMVLEEVVGLHQVEEGVVEDHLFLARVEEEGDHNLEGVEVGVAAEGLLRSVEEVGVVVHQVVEEVVMAQSHQRLEVMEEVEVEAQE